MPITIAVLLCECSDKNCNSANILSGALVHDFVVVVLRISFSAYCFTIVAVLNEQNYLRLFFFFSQ